MRAVIMAGGKGTRLQSVAADIPKPMFPILKKPILLYQIESLKKCGVTEITIIVGHLGKVIEEYFQDGSEYGVTIEYIRETEPLGTAGALFFLREKLTDDFLLIFGDLILDVDWDRFLSFHKKKNSIVTLYCHPNGHPYDSDLIIADKNGRVEKIQYKKEDRTFYYHNLVNAGIYCVNSKLLQGMKGVRKTDFEKDLMAKQISGGNVYAYRGTEYIKDMGTPERLREVTADIENGVVTGRNLKKRQRAVFLDRDGTINVWNGLIKRAEDFELIPHTSEAIKRINSSEYLAIVATNQPVIARGECSFEELDRIHMKMETILGDEGAYVDDLFFCPHHPHKGYVGEVPELKIECECRKPRIGMITQAAEKYNIDLSQSWYVGDTARDIQTGINAGMRTVLVRTGENTENEERDIWPDYMANNLFEAVEIILSNSN